MTAALTDPTLPAPCPAPPPFWAALVDAPTGPAALVADPAVSATAAGLPRVDAPEPMPDAAAAPDGSPRSVDLVLADLTDTAGAPIDGRLGMLAAGMLCGGGVLAVLARVGHSADGVLVDATGGIVASAQNADLLYLQHIVIPARPLRPPRATDAAADQAGDVPTAHEVAHADLLVFARPRAGNTHAESGMAATADATAGVPSSVVVASASGGVRQ